MSVRCTIACAKWSRSQAMPDESTPEGVGRRLTPPAAIRGYLRLARRSHRNPSKGDGIMKSDIQLHRDVVEELAWQPSIREAEIGVAVKDGVVTLSGFVGSYAQKIAAERAAEHVSGIRAVADALEVKLAASHAHSDTELAHRVARALEWNAEVPVETVQACVQNGWVTLDGEVEWQFQREAACCAVRSLTGVTGVENRIRLHPQATSYDVRQRIRDALRRSAEAGVRKIADEAPAAVRGVDDQMIVAT
jgi:osmotically-inducible protein OsmY